MSSAPDALRWRSLLAPGLATFVCLTLLLGLGFWQLARKAEKESLIATIIDRSKETPPAPLPAFEAWNRQADEFRHVQATGSFENDRETLIHGLAPGLVPGRASQGFYVIVPLKREDGTIVLVNRGFVPTELKRPTDRSDGQIAGPTTVTGILRGSETRSLFVPEPSPAKGEWFHRDIAGIAAAKGLGPVAPYMIEADGTPNAGSWPRGGQLRVDLPNNHMQYAFTWFGIAACLIGVFSVFAWTRLNTNAEEST